MHRLSISPLQAATIVMECWQLVRGSGLSHREDTAISEQGLKQTHHEAGNNQYLSLTNGLVAWGLCSPFDFCQKAQTSASFPLI